MSDVEGGRQSLAGLTLDDVLRLQKAPPQAPPLPPPTAPSGQPVTRLLRNQTLIDIIQDAHSNKKEKTPWKAFKDRLLNKRSSATWTSSVPTPISDISIPNNKNKGHRASSNKSSRKGSLRYVTPASNSGRQLSPNTNYNDSPFAGDNSNSASTPQFSRIASTRINSNRSDSTRFGDSFDADASYVPDLQISRHNANHQVPTSDPMTHERRIASRVVDPDAADYNDQPDSPEDRTLSAREAVQAQEAAEAAAAASAAEAEADADAGGGGLKMSLMDLLEEEGLSYMMDDDDDEEYEDEDEDEDNIVEQKEETSIEYNCCVCMVRHKGAAFIPCGHAFCRLCSRELYASRGNCPLCNNFIAEILDIF